MDQKEKITPQSILKSKKIGRKISMLTAYDFAMASIFDEAGIEILLVGDSLGNVMLGYKDTIPVTLEEIIVHLIGVSKGATKALVVADLPFGSYQISTEKAVESAILLSKNGAEAVKLEGGEYPEAIKEIIKAGIPVMGHLGFTPQSVNILGYQKQGKTKEGEEKIIADALLLEKLGAFSIVLELIPEELGEKISKLLKIPVIGIGAGKKCDGQVLVSYDMLGIYQNPPSFVKKYGNLRGEIISSVKNFISDIIEE